MRRTEKAIAERSGIEAVIRACQVCRLGLCDEGTPYIVPLCFGYDGTSLYFHCASEGRKLDILRRNPRVCFEFDVVHGLREGEAACSWSIRYQSVMGTGRAVLLVDPEEKRRALAILMAQYAEGEFTFPDNAVDRIIAIRVDIHEITGKQSL